MNINPSQRKHLKSLAHYLKPIVSIGKEGLTRGAIHFILEVLEKNELIKIKFSKNKDSKKDMARKIITKTKSLASH